MAHTPVGAQLPFFCVICELGVHSCVVLVTVMLMFIIAIPLLTSSSCAPRQSPEVRCL